MNKGASSCVFCRHGSHRAYKTCKNWHVLGEFGLYYYYYILLLLFILFIYISYFN
jgi:hypothetical protein